MISKSKTPLVFAMRWSIRLLATFPLKPKSCSRYPSSTLFLLKDAIIREATQTFLSLTILTWGRISSSPRLLTTAPLTRRQPVLPISVLDTASLSDRQSTWISSRPDGESSLFWLSILRGKSNTGRDWWFWGRVGSWLWRASTRITRARSLTTSIKSMKQSLWFLLSMIPQKIPSWLTEVLSLVWFSSHIGNMILLSLRSSTFRREWIYTGTESKAGSTKPRPSRYSRLWAISPDCWLIRSWQICFRKRRTKRRLL